MYVYSRIGFTVGAHVRSTINDGTHTRIHTRTHTRPLSLSLTHTHTHTQTHTLMCVCVYRWYSCAVRHWRCHTHAHKRTHAHTHIHTHTHTHVSTQVVLMCGPPLMMDRAVKPNLEKLGFDKSQMLAFWVSEAPTLKKWGVREVLSNWNDEGLMGELEKKKEKDPYSISLHDDSVLWCWVWLMLLLLLYKK